MVPHSTTPTTFHPCGLRWISPFPTVCTLGLPRPPFVDAAPFYYFFFLLRRFAGGRGGEGVANAGWRVGRGRAWVRWRCVVDIDWCLCACVMVPYMCIFIRMLSCLTLIDMYVCMYICPAAQSSHTSLPTYLPACVRACKSTHTYLHNLPPLAPAHQISKSQQARTYVHT